MQLRVTIDASSPQRGLCQGASKLLDPRSSSTIPPGWEALRSQESIPVITALLISGGEKPCCETTSAEERHLCPMQPPQGENMGNVPDTAADPLAPVPCPSWAAAPENAGSVPQSIHRLCTSTLLPPSPRTDRCSPSAEEPRQSSLPNLTRCVPGPGFWPIYPGESRSPRCLEVSPALPFLEHKQQCFCTCLSSAWKEGCMPRISTAETRPFPAADPLL